MLGVHKESVVSLQLLQLKTLLLQSPTCTCDVLNNSLAVPESYGGLYLVRRGDFNSGAHINSFVRVHCKPASLLSEKRHATFFGKAASFE